MEDLEELISTTPERGAEVFDEGVLVAGTLAGIALFAWAM